MPTDFRINRRKFDPADCTQLRLPHLMGILNVTPDSFSDGAQFLAPDAAAGHALELLADGAEVIDIGAESTRPGAPDLRPQVEIDRLLPVIRRIRTAAPDAVLSIDTRKAEVADAVLEAGADIINDVSGLTYDPALAEATARHRAGLCVMHMRGTPGTMQNPENLRYENLIGEVKAFLLNAQAKALAAGVEPESILLDPGVGFSKTVEQNFELIRAVREFRETGLQVLYGVSRKSFLKSCAENAEPVQRDAATAGVLTYLTLLNADFLRVHNVRMARDAVRAFGSCCSKKL